MTSNFLRILFLALFMVSNITTCSAVDVVLLDDQLLIKGVDDEAGLGVFDIVLCYGSDTIVNSVEVLSPFIGAYNIQNPEGKTIVAGVQISDALKGDVPVAKLEYKNGDDIQIFVKELANVKGKSILYNTPEYKGSMPEKGTVFPEIADLIVDTPQSSTGREIGSYNNTTEGVQMGAELAQLENNTDSNLNDSVDDPLNSAKNSVLA
ncbi:MAG: hypothetical protein PHV51_05355, partial [Methanosarcinaceae archaeon]|nr:hypothetical protein [Methanosarcinaceae archaeon]